MRHHKIKSHCSTVNALVDTFFAVLAAATGLLRDGLGGHGRNGLGFLTSAASNRRHHISSNLVVFELMTSTVLASLALGAVGH
jgi:hypothetical protein